MRVFRTTYKDRQGRTKTAAKWYVEFSDHRETTRRLPAFTDRKQSEAFGRNCEKLVGCRLAGEKPSGDLAKWVETLSNGIRAKLAKLDLLDARTMAASKPLSEHVADFQAAMLNKGTTAKQANQVTNRIKRLFADCGFQYWSDVSAAEVSKQLAKLRESGRSLQTSNFYLAAAKQFGKWLVAERRASESPLEHLQGHNVETDRRHQRRALTVDELRWLLSTTARGPERGKTPGSERAKVYRVAVETGLRASELASLERSSFNLDAEQPTVTIKAGYSKRRRQDVLPIRPELAAMLREHFRHKLPGAKAFIMPKLDHGARVLRADLAAARKAWIAKAQDAQERERRKQSDFLTYRNHEGHVADFHALRHTFVTNLANGDVHPKTAMELARHSTIALTIDRYSHANWESMAGALNRLPDLDPIEREAQRATGTDGQIVLADCLAPKGAFGGDSVQSGAVNSPMAGGSETPENLGENGQNAAEKRMGWDSNPRNGLTRSTVFKTVADSSQGHADNSVTEAAPVVLADCLALLRREKPDLATVAAAWDDLPEAIRAAILALVEAGR